MDRFLVLLGLFYATQNKGATALQLYSQAIGNLEKRNDINCTLVMAKNLVGRLLLKDKNR